jgi:predicted transcriptional regulator
LRAFGDDEGAVQDGQISLWSSNKLLLQDIYSLITAKFPELKEFGVLHDYMNNKNHMHTIRFKTGVLSSYMNLIGFTHPEKQKEVDYFLTRQTRGWGQRPQGVTRRMLLEILASSSSITVKALAQKLVVTVGPIRKHLKALMKMNFVQVQNGEIGPYGAKLFEITKKGLRFLEILKSFAERDLIEKENELFTFFPNF